jgi:hypothetical protein
MTGLTQCRDRHGVDIRAITGTALRWKILC